MSLITSKLGRKVVVTELITGRDRARLSVGDIGTIVELSSASGVHVQFPNSLCTDPIYMLLSQLRKYKEPKHLKLKVGDEVKIRNYTKYPELRVDSTRRYHKDMEAFIGTTQRVTCVYPDGSVCLSNDYAYCTTTLKRVKPPKPTEITVGSKVRVTTLIGLDSVKGIKVGGNYTVVRYEVDSADVYISTPSGEERFMTRSQIELVS